MSENINKIRAKTYFISKYSEIDGSQIFYKEYNERNYNNSAKIALFEEYIITSVKDHSLFLHDAIGTKLGEFRTPTSSVVSTNGGIQIIDSYSKKLY